MFDIRFVDSIDLLGSENPKVGELYLETGIPYRKIQTEDGDIFFDAYGKITIGSFTEAFRAPLFFWSKEDYEAQWKAALRRLVLGANKTALLTAMYDPLKAKFITWWPMYREGDVIYIQNEILVMDELTQPFDITKVDEFVGSRDTNCVDGRKPSEWSIMISDLQECAWLK